MQNIEFIHFPDDQPDDLERDDDALFLGLQVRSLICFLNEVEFFWNTKDSSHAPGSFQNATDIFNSIRSQIKELDRLNTEVFKASWEDTTDLLQMRYQYLNQEYQVLKN